jgi:hypothetical protein
LGRWHPPQAIPPYCSETAAAEQDLRDIESSRGTLSAFVRFAELHLLDIARAWQIAEPEQRQRVQNLLFDDGLHYSPASGILSRSNSSLFSMLEAMTDEKACWRARLDLNPWYRRESKSLNRQPNQRVCDRSRQSDPDFQPYKGFPSLDPCFFMLSCTPSTHGSKRWK